MMKKILKWTFYIFVALFMMGIISAVVDGDKASVNTQAEEVNHSVVEQTASPTDSKKVGDIVQVGYWNYTVLEAKEQKTVKGLFKSKKPDGEKFIVVKIKAENIHTDACTFDSNLFKLIDGNGYEYSCTTKIHDDNSFLKKVNPHVSITADIAFDVPDHHLDWFKLRADGGFTSLDQVEIDLTSSKR